MNNLMTIPAQDTIEQSMEQFINSQQSDISMVCRTLSRIGHYNSIRILFTGSIMLNMRKLLNRPVSDIDISLESFQDKDKVLNLLSTVYNSVREFDVSMDYETAERSTDTHFRYLIGTVKVCLFVRKDEHIESTIMWSDNQFDQVFPMHFGGFRATMEAKLRYALKYTESAIKHRMDLISIMNKLIH